MTNLEPFPIRLATLISNTFPFIETLPSYFSPLTNPLYNGLNQLGASTGLGDGELILFMLCLWSSFGLMLLMRVVPSGTVRMVLTSFFGLTIAFIMFGTGALHSVVCVLFGYIMLLCSWLLCRLGLGPNSKAEVFSSAKSNSQIDEDQERKKVKDIFKNPVLFYLGKLSLFVYITMFVHLFLIHWYRISVDYLGWHLDSSLIQMLLVLKIISIQYNYYDGVKVRLLRLQNIDPKKHMYPQHVDFSIQRIPSPLEYFSFFYFFPIIISGPVVEFTDFVQWAYSKNLPWAPIQAIKTLFWGFLCMAIYIGVGPYFSMDKILKSPYIDTAPVYMLLFTQLIGGITLRAKYFISWYFGQANCVIGGFGATWNKDTKQWDFTGIDQAKFLEVEFCTSIRDFSNSWNANVSRWLRLYTYSRVSDITYGKSGGLYNMVCTMVTSAIWHGLYPGYYLMWIVLSFISEVHKTFFRKVTRNVLTYEEITSKKYTPRVIVWNIVSWFLTQIMASNLVSSFELLSLEDSIRYLNRCYWIVHVVALITGIVVFTMPPIRSNSKPKKQ